MSRYDGRAADASSYRDRCSEGAFGGGSRAFAAPSKADASAAASELDGLPRFEKNFYVESPAVAGMTEEEVEAYRRRREITVEGRDVPKPVLEFCDVGFPAVVVLAANVALVPLLFRAQDLKRWCQLALVLLVSACPCALVLSTPVATFCAFLRAARMGSHQGRGRS